MPTWNSRGLRGSTLEDLLNRTNEKYAQNGLALIQKIPTPITPINIDKETRHITLAYFEQKSTVDSAQYDRLYWSGTGNSGVFRCKRMQHRHLSACQCSSASGGFYGAV